jgi:hypothetical protein
MEENMEEFDYDQLFMDIYADEGSNNRVPRPAAMVNSVKPYNPCLGEAFICLWTSPAAPDHMVTLKVRPSWRWWAWTRALLGV